MSVLPLAPGATLAGALQTARLGRPDDVILTAHERRWTVRELAAFVDRLRTGLAAQGLRPGDRLLAALGNSVDHVALFLAAIASGLVWVPIGADRRGAGLRHVVDMTQPALAIAEPEAAGALAAAGLEAVIVRQPGLEALSATGVPPEPMASDERTCCLMFTSGSTGPPKAVMLTERMLLASAFAAGTACDIETGDAFLVWEPLIHIGGAQLIPLALSHSITLHIAERFSASRFWDQVRHNRVTKLHYLGGILDILLKQPERPDDHDHDHGVKLAFGAGCRPEAWHRFEARFGIPIREVYGMTEASSFTTLNRNGVIGSIGRPLPWFDLALLDEHGLPAPPGSAGEIVVKALEPGLLTNGYLNDPEATADLFRDGALRTGDLATRDDDGNLFYVGRLRDAIRRRGELISAWEIETAINAHPAISESAVVAVPADIGEEEILAFFLPTEGARISAAELSTWCAGRLSQSQIPRYWHEIDRFPRTPSHRIDKKALPRDLGRMIDVPSRQGS